MATASTVAAMVSVRSMSVTVTVPVSVKVVFVSPKAEVSAPWLMTGVSLVPVMVMATVVVVSAGESEPVAPLLSVRVRV